MIHTYGEHDEHEQLVAICMMDRHTVQFYGTLQHVQFLDPSAFM